jgi:DNA-directed RNA polymerase specialized sigma24 family protein
VLRARRATPAAVPDVDELSTPNANALDALVRAEDLAAMRRALAELPNADVDLLKRCFVAGESVATIARSTGDPADRVRKRKSRAIARLRHSLGLSPNALL